MTQLLPARRVAARPLTVSIASLLLAMGCTGRHEPEKVELWSSDPPFTRHVDASAWDTAWVVGGGMEDTTLLRPRLLSPHRNGIYIYDDGREQVVSLTLTGQRRWAVGGLGGGPTEFRMVRDIKVDDLGRAVVLDPANQRISVIDSAGHFVRRVPMTSVGWAEQVLPLGLSRYVLSTNDSTHPFAVLDTTGTVVGRFSVPWKPFAVLDPIARQGLISRGPGDRWTYAFTIGDGWFSFRSTKPENRPGRYVEHTKFPEIVKTKRGNGVMTEMANYTGCSGCSVSIADSVFYVHFGGTSADQKRLVDRYALSTQRYLGSYQLPARASSVAVFGDRTYVLQSDTITQLLALKPRLGQH